jgi:molybdopterin-containing oxidoreductase family iron-sulfur binding subunit
MSKRAPYASTPTGTAGEPAGQLFWRSLETKADPAREQAEATAEFPLRLDGPVTARTVAADDRVGDAGDDKMGRRSLFKLAGTAVAASTIAACRRPVEKLVPYTVQVEYSVPGVPYHYASARVERGDVIGIVAEVHENRPTKLEGNPDHPANRGTSDLRTQAAILDLYDPDRPGKISRKEGDKRVDANHAELDRFLADTIKRSTADQGAKLRLLVEPSVSPTFFRLRAAFKAKFPQAKVYSWTPLDLTNVVEGSKIAFGSAVNTVHDFAMARAILALDSDFLQTEPGMLRATRTFVRGRQAHRPMEGMSRLYVVEPNYTTTGSNADHRLRLPAREIEAYLLALCAELAKGQGLSGDLAQYTKGASLPAGVPQSWVTAVAKDLIAHRGRSLVVAGSRQPARVHALVHAVNAALGNSGESVHFYAATEEDEPSPLADIKQLAAELDAGKVDTLITLGGNPAFDAPADLAFGDKIAKAKNSLHLGSHLDETAVRSSWYVPRAHDLEAWGDVRSLEGTVSLVQPVIAPLHDGVSDLQILSTLAGEAATAGSEAVQATLRGGVKGIVNFDRIWNTALQRGVVENAPSRPLPSPPIAAGAILTALAAGKRSTRPLGPDNLEVSFLPDPKILDGRHANNPWLLELPDPLSKLVWDNAAYVSPDTAKALGVANNDVIHLGRDGGGAGLDVAVFVLPGVAENCVALHLGWGRTNAGRYGGLPERVGDDRYAGPQGIYPFVQAMPHNGAIRGFNAYALRTSDALWFADGFKATKTGKKYPLVTTHEHHTMEGRPIAIDATLAEFKKNPDFPQWKSPDPKVLPLWTPQEYTGHKWGMAIDLSVCTGCNACTIACQAENNIAFVGKDQVARGREMYWIRVDRYFVGNEEADPQIAYQPVACVHCEQAPCENVCPVNATEHSPEGLNDMAYNRCVGTRYCANNCPYKVRRFNYLEFQGDPMYGDLPETLKMQFNPNVTVRMRGIMEKCTYCVQRIEEARISARRDGRPLKDGDIVTACAQSCPADAIVFGDLNEPRSRVATLAAMGRGYHLLSELGTHPRTTHLGKIRNPNTEMA